VFSRIFFALRRRSLRARAAAMTGVAVPKLPNTTFELLSFREAETIAKHTGREVAFIRVDAPRIEGASAAIVLGVDIASPPDTDMVKMCCCTGRAELRRAAGDRWVFVKWSQTTCS
jgi:hypothetical protein